jgi:hypothetical protein
MTHSASGGERYLLARDQNDGSNRKKRDQLVQIDTLLDEWPAGASELVADLILELWDLSQKEGFSQQLFGKAEKWRVKYAMDVAAGKPAHATGERLHHMLFLREEKQAKDLLAREKMRKAGKVVPSVRYRTPREPIEDSEVEGFLGMLDREGFLSVFDPKNIIVEGAIFTCPFVAYRDLRLSYEELKEKYSRGLPRPWDPVQRKVDDAMLIDWILVSARREGKWTWVICDRYFIRLPFGHPLKSVGGERPGWNWSRRELEAIDLMRQGGGRTWRLTPVARQWVDREIIPMWQATRQ